MKDLLVKTVYFFPFKMATRKTYVKKTVLLSNSTVNAFTQNAFTIHLLKRRAQMKSASLLSQNLKAGKLIRIKMTLSVTDLYRIVRVAEKQ